MVLLEETNSVLVTLLAFLWNRVSQVTLQEHCDILERLFSGSDIME
jgi:hypothetical protein